MKTNKKTFWLGAALAASVAVIGIASFADSPTFVSKSGSGTTSTEIIFPADPVSQIRLVVAIASSDKAASKFTFSAGTPLNR